MKFFFILLIIIFVMMKEIPQMIRGRNYKELIIYSILLLLGTTYVIDLVYHLHLPNPTKGITSIFRPFTIWLEHRLL
ncbi:hypothetical protein O9H85_03485 [Paenibacillus filicis]|uniref:Uncharacterized protein n=1 Tax=Paenibacillus gyeongsangnamensis TaxID=3388067 RepID=A0ABT4Q493_9BACL|nr:hypothetical protein [Paenibacillus filicis]MCZ8511510.1 hypothetical protein [Paenibacillus filicis]